MEALIHVFRTRERQASKGLIMWRTPSSRGSDWRLSCRSVTAIVHVVKKKREGKWEDVSMSAVTSSYYCLSQTGSYRLCELSGVEWTRRVSLQNLKNSPYYSVWPGITGWATLPCNYAKHSREHYRHCMYSYCWVIYTRPTMFHSSVMGSVCLQMHFKQLIICVTFDSFMEGLI